MTYVRRSARVIVVDDEFNVLLFRFFFNPKKKEEGHFWITPGGGVDKGEELAHAASRELREETGLRAAAEELHYVGHAEGYANIDWADSSHEGMFRDDYFFWRTPTREVDDSLQEDWERTQITGHHWWSIAELAATQERVVPPRLAELLTALGDGTHRAPCQLQWHH